MYGPDEDDLVEHGRAPLRVPGWVRRPRWLPALDRRASRGAAILGIAGLIVGLAAGYTLGYRRLGQAVWPSRVIATGAAPPGRVRLPAPPGPRVRREFRGLLLRPQHRRTNRGRAGPGRRSVLGAAWPRLQVGVEVINLSGTAVTLGQVRPILPMGGLRAVSQQWAPCGAISPSWEVVGSGGTVMIIAVRRDGPADVPGATMPGGALPGSDVVPPDGTAWLSVTFQVLVACPRPLPVQFSVSYQENSDLYVFVGWSSQPGAEKHRSQSPWARVFFHTQTYYGTGLGKLSDQYANDGPSQQLFALVSAQQPRAELTVSPLEFLFKEHADGERPDN